MSDRVSPSPEAGSAVPGLNPLFHEQVRLLVLAALAPADYVEFAALLQLTRASKSALSKHLSALADAGVIEVSQNATDKRGRRVALTARGRTEFEAYLEGLERIVRNARR
jgi:DNA-binding MarR family transcriptional regulator